MMDTHEIRKTLERLGYQQLHEGSIARTDGVMKLTQWLNYRLDQPTILFLVEYPGRLGYDVFGSITEQESFRGLAEQLGMGPVYPAAW